MCSAPALAFCDFCAWRRLLLICWKLLIGVCVRDGLAASVCVYRTSAASVELRPRGWRAVAFPRWLHLGDRSGSTWLIVILMVRCCFGGLCVRDRLAACLRMSHFCCFRSASSSGSRAVAFPLWLQVLSCSTWLIVCCCFNSSSCVFCFGPFGFIGANSNSMNSISRAASSGR